jgi:hypothetical protein
MRDKLSALLGVSSEEGHKVSMLLTQSVFIGIFIGAFDITAYSLLLSTYDEKLMARGYVVSGVAGFILTLLYLNLRSKYDFRKFATINLLFILAIVGALWLAVSSSTEKGIIFLIFVMLAPLNILSFLGFWRTTERLFNGKPEKVFRFLEGGLITGILIVSFVIPVILSFKFQTYNILIVSILSVLVAIIVQMLINKRFSINGAIAEEYTENITKRLPLFLKKDPFQRTLGLFTALSVLTAFLIQYMFMSVTRKQFPVSEDMAVFLGIFTGIMMIFNLFMKYMGFPFIIHRYRINLSLIISPVLITILSVVTIVSGFSITQAAKGFMIIVLILGFNRLISKSFKDSVEIPSYKIIFQSVSKKLRPQLQSGIDGTVNEMGLIFSGIVLAGFGFLSFFKLIHFSILLFIVSLIWIFVGVKLLKRYNNSLEKTAVSDPAVDEFQPVFNNRFTSGLEFRKDYFGIISGNYSSLIKINERYFEQLSTHAISRKDINLLPAFRKIANNPSLGNIIRQRSHEIIETLNSRNISTDEGLRLLAGTRLPQTTEILKLLRNNSIESKKLAIHIIGKFRITDLLSVVCESLSSPGLAQDAYEVLLSFGEGVEDELLRFYLINSGNVKLSRIILQLLGNTCSKESSGFLFSNLWSNSRQIKEISVKSLLKFKFKPSEEEKARLENLIFEIIGIMAWNLNAEITLERQKNDFLLDKIKLENKRMEIFLFNVLSLTYGIDIIGEIRRNLSEKTFESTCHALEIVRKVVSVSIQPNLLVLLDDIPVRKKVKKLSENYAIESSRHNLAEEIINRDYNLISIWTKACTLRCISKIEGKEMEESVTALLFSPEDIIQEESAYLIARSNPDLYYSASPRIPVQVKRKLDRIVNGSFDKKGMLFERVQFLTDCFTEIPAWELFTLAAELHFINNKDINSVNGSEGNIIWSLKNDNSYQDVEIVYNGAIGKMKDKTDVETPNSDSTDLFFYQLSLNSVEEYHFQYPDRSREILGYVDKIQETSE